jgi:hypothetical protein
LDVITADHENLGHNDDEENQTSGESGHPDARTGLAQQQSPLHGEAELRDGRDRAPDGDARDPVVVQADTGHVDHGEDRAKAAA